MQQKQHDLTLEEFYLKHGEKEPEKASGWNPVCKKCGVRKSSIDESGVCSKCRKGERKDLVNKKHKEYLNAIVEGMVA